MKVSLAHSPDSDDAFMFYGLARGKVDTGGLEIVPGLELPAKTGAGLVFADRGNWLFLTVSYGDHLHVLAWRPGLGAPQEVARLDGPVAWAPPLLIT